MQSIMIRIFLQLLFCLTLHNVLGLISCLRHTSRSVEVCENIEGITDCRLHCANHMSNIEMEWDSKTMFSEEEDQDTTTDEESQNLMQQKRCCCRYDKPWPEFVNKVKDSSPHRTYNAIHCIPVTKIRIFIERLSLTSFWRACSILGSYKRPLTVSEAYNLVDNVSYLNYMQTRHPSIWLLLTMKEVKKLNKELKRVLTNNMGMILHATSNNLDDYDGARLTTEQLTLFARVRKEELRPLRESMFLKDTMDEFFLSYAIMDLHAAKEYTINVNRELNIDISNDFYDAYDDDVYFYHDMDSLDCKKIRHLKGKTAIYLSSMERFVSSMDEKGIYDAWKEKFTALKYLIKRQELYTRIIKANCEKRKIFH